MTDTQTPIAGPCVRWVPNLVGAWEYVECEVNAIGRTEELTHTATGYVPARSDDEVDRGPCTKPALN